MFLPSSIPFLVQFFTFILLCFINTSFLLNFLFISFLPSCFFPSNTFSFLLPFLNLLCRPLFFIFPSLLFLFNYSFTFPPSILSFYLSSFPPCYRNSFLLSLILSVLFPSSLIPYTVSSSLYFSSSFSIPFCLSFLSCIY